MMDEQAVAYLKERGIIDETVLAHSGARIGRIGSDEDDRLVLPWYDAGGEEIYKTGRSLNGSKPRYKQFGTRPPLFASPGAWDADVVVLVEGQIDALAAASGGTPAFATATASLHEDAVELLRGKKILLVPDTDEDGGKWFEDVATKLAGACELWVVLLHDEGVKDLAEYAANASGDPAAIAAILANNLRIKRPDEGPDDDEDELEQEVRRLRIRREARRIVDAEERPPAPVVEILTLSEALAIPRPPLEFRVERLQPRDSKVMFSGPAKAGKTSVRDNLVRCLVDGDPLLDGFAVVPVHGSVVLIDVEMSERMMIDWLDDQSIRNIDAVIPIALRGKVTAFDIFDPDTFASWVKTFREREASYLILDPLRPIMDCLGLDEHRDGGRFLVRLDQLAEEAGIGELLVIHHHGHAGERARGDSRFRDWPDCEWRLVRQDPDDQSSPRFFSAVGRDVDLPECRLEYDPASRRLSIGGGSRRDEALHAALDEVLLLLTVEPGLSGRAIESRSNLGQKVVRAALALGREQGSIRTEQGPKRAILHYADPSSASVRPSASLVRQRASGECVSAYLEDAHAHTPAGDASASVQPDLLVVGEGDNQ